MKEQAEIIAAPAVSIGMPVYNGEKYIRNALDSVLAQTFADFELLISDNCSSDDTREICLEYSTKDTRIKYIRQSENHGGHWNFNFVTQNVTGNLITWLAHDDILEPGYLKTAVKYMQENPDTVLVATDFEVIDQNGIVLGIQSLETIRTNINWEQRCAEFFKYPISNVFFCIYGLMRTRTCQAILQSIAEPRMATGSELPILARFAVKGKIASIPAVLRKYRSHADSVYSCEVATIATRPVHRRILIDIANIYRLRIDQLVVLFSSSYPSGLKYRILIKVICFYVIYFSSKAIKTPVKLATILKSRLKFA